MRRKVINVDNFQPIRATDIAKLPFIQLTNVVSHALNLYSEHGYGFHWIVPTSEILLNPWSAGGALYPILLGAYGKLYSVANSGMFDSYGILDFEVNPKTIEEGSSTKNTAIDETFNDTTQNNVDETITETKNGSVDGTVKDTNTLTIDDKGSTMNDSMTEDSPLNAVIGDITTPSNKGISESSYSVTQTNSDNKNRENKSTTTENNSNTKTSENSITATKSKKGDNAENDTYQTTITRSGSKEELEALILKLSTMETHNLITLFREAFTPYILEFNIVE